MTEIQKPTPKFKTLQVHYEGELDRPKAIAQAVLRPEVGAAITCQYFLEQGDGLDLMATVDAISSQSLAVIGNDTERMQAMLISQAHTLDVIFNQLAQRAYKNMREYMDATDTYMRLALKAQNQSRMTLETLAAIKNPPVVYAKQANFSQGHQQVNNGVAQTMPAPTAHAENSNQTNGLLGGSHGEPLDTRAQGKAGGSDSGVEAVGAINRPKKRGGKDA